MSRNPVPGAKIACGHGIRGVQETFTRVFNMTDAAFIGDTLFAPAFGTERCDFPGGSAAQLYDSIEKLYDLPEKTRLFLCHDYPKAGDEPVLEVTVEESRNRNIHMKTETTKEEFVAMRTHRDSQLGLPRPLGPTPTARCTCVRHSTTYWQI